MGKIGVEIYLMKNRSRSKFILAFVLFGLLLFSPRASADSVGASEHVQVELFSEVESVKPGEPFWVGVRMTMQPEWHTYWQNPGDAGLETQIKWKLPEGFSAGPLQWPFPMRIEIPPLVDFGYKNEIILLSEIMVPGTPVGTPVPIAAKMDWLECKDICIPGSAEVNLTLPVTNETPAQNALRANDFERARTQIPKKIDPSSDWNFRAARTGEKISIFFAVPGNPSIGDVTFFPMDRNIYNYTEKQKFRTRPDGYELESTLSKLLEGEVVKTSGVLVSSNGWGGPGTEKAIEIEVPVYSLGPAIKTPLAQPSLRGDFVGASFTTPAESAGAVNRAPTADKFKGFSFLLALAFAFLGGLLLNLMPCVLPVLSLKVLGFIKQGGENPKAVRIHGFLFGFGVLVSFWALALALLALRAGGRQLGWGFQLQSPAFVAALASLFFLLALNLFGMFEWGSFFSRAGEVTSQTKGFLNSFLSGFLATIIATPCTAPFMGAALGFGLTQPPWVSFLIFTSLALGMALPYLLLSLNPVLLRFVPKPGAWMIAFKKIMALPLLATTIWLSWVLHVQIGNYVFLVLPASLLFLFIAARNLGQNISPETTTEKITRLIAFALIALGFVWATVSAAWSEAIFAEAASNKIVVSDGISWENFSGERLAELRAEGKPVFIDFTAAWCLTCQVNERLVLNSKNIQNKFRELGVAMLKADWTRRDENITRAIQSYGRSGVPLYVLYHPKDEKPVIFPEVLTSKIVLDALEKIGS